MIALIMVTDKLYSNGLLSVNFCLFLVSKKDEQQYIIKTSPPCKTKQKRTLFSSVLLQFCQVYCLSFTQVHHCQRSLWILNCPHHHSSLLPSHFSNHLKLLQSVRCPGQVKQMSPRLAVFILMSNKNHMHPTMVGACFHYGLLESRPHEVISTIEPHKKISCFSCSLWVSEWKPGGSCHTVK